jgi:hypothetical protein
VAGRALQACCAGLASLGVIFAGPRPSVAADGSAPSAAPGEVSVFSDQVAHAIDSPTPAQQARGFFGGGSISGLFPTDQPGHVMLVTPPGDALVGRHLDLALAGLPFLTWSWRRLLPDSGPVETLASDAPMRIVVGFTGGGTRQASEPAPTQPPDGLQLPPFERALVVIWSNQAWESGTADRRGSVGRFVAHGGAGDGQWWEQTVDLADLHARLWPETKQADVRVAWIAVAVRQSDGRSLGEIAGVALAP